MTWTYGNSPSTSNRDAVRLLIGQTSSGDPILVTDEEIAFYLAQNAGIYCAAADAGAGLAQAYASKVGGADSLTVGNLSESYGDRSAKLTATVERLRRQCRMRSVQPVAGGVLLADYEAYRADTSLTPHVFSIGMDDNPSADQLSSTAV